MWTRLDDALNESTKVDSLSPAAFQLWVMVLVESRKGKRLHLEGKFRANELTTLCRGKWRGKELDDLAQEIVEANYGDSGLGLWEPIDGGYQIHDWHQYGPTREPMSASERGRIGGQRSAELRELRTGSSIPDGAPNRRSKTISFGTASGLLAEAKPIASEQVDVCLPKQGPSKTLASGLLAEARDPGSRIPDPEDLVLKQEAGSKDLTAGERVVPPPLVVERRSESGMANADTGLGRQRASGTTEGAPGRADRNPTSERNVVPQARPPTRRERASDDLMTCQIAELAARCRSNPYDAAQTAICDRPEVVEINQLWSRSVGVTLRRLGCYSDNNRPLRAILEALETTTVEDLRLVCEQAAHDDWCTGKKGTDRDPARKRDVGCLTPTVLSRLLEAAKARAGSQVHSNPVVARILAEESARRSA